MSFYWYVRLLYDDADLWTVFGLPIENSIAMTTNIEMFHEWGPCRV